MNRFLGKVAVVTGAASGTGSAAVKELLQYDLIVVGVDNNSEKLQNYANDIKVGEYRGKFHWKECDVTKKIDITETFEWIDHNIGPVAILISCAGVLFRTTLLDADEDDITKTFDVNVKGLLLCAKEAMKLMISNGIDGHIININSINGHYIRKRSTISTTMIYAASKHGVTVLSEGLRQEIRQRNLKIKCTSISPGHVLTPLSDQGNTVGYLEALNPEDVANACVAALNTPLHVQVTELTITGLHQEL